MKKKLAFLLAAIMVITSIPGMTLFANSSANSITRVLPTQNNTLLFEEHLPLDMTVNTEFTVGQHPGRQIQYWQTGTSLQLRATQTIEAGDMFHVDLDGAAWYFRQDARTPSVAPGNYIWNAGTAVTASAAVPTFDFDLTVLDFDDLPFGVPTTGTDETAASMALIANQLAALMTFPATALTPVNTVIGTWTPQTAPLPPLTAASQWFNVTATAEELVEALVLATAEWTWDFTAAVSGSPVTFNISVPAGNVTATATHFQTVYVPGGPVGVTLAAVQEPGLASTALNAWPNPANRDTFIFAHPDVPSSLLGRDGGYVVNLGGAGVAANILYTRVAGANSPSGFPAGTRLYTMNIVGGNATPRATVTLLQNFDRDDTIVIPLVARTTTAGDVRVRVERGTSQVQAGTWVVGNQIDGRVTVTFTGATVRHHEIAGIQLNLIEQRPGSIPGNQTWAFELTAPVGYEWAQVTNASNVIIDHQLAWATGLPTGARAANTAIGAMVGDRPGSGVHVGFAEGRNNVQDRSTLVVTVPGPITADPLATPPIAGRPAVLTSSTGGTGGIMRITGLRLIPEDDTVREGRLYVGVRNTERNVLPEANVFVATAADFGITLNRVTAAVPELISGRYEIRGQDAIMRTSPTGANAWGGDAIDSYHRAATVRFQETIQDSWWAMRNTVFTLPEGVRFLQVEVYDQRSMLAGHAANEQLWQGSNAAGGNNRNPNPFFNSGTRIGSVTVDHERLVLHGLSVTANETARFDLRIWLNIQVDFEGPIYLSLANTAFRQIDDNYDVSTLIATAVSPITVETEVTEARVGFQFVTTADFDIIENVAGALLQGEDVFVSVTDQMSADMILAPGFSSAVTEGNIRVGQMRTRSALGVQGIGTGGQWGQLQFTVERASTVESTISFTNVQVRIDRTVPFSNISVIETSGYDIHVWGPAVARNFRGLHGENNEFNRNNNRWNERDFFPIGSVSAQYVLIETPPEFGANEFRNHVEVTVGSTTAMVNGQPFEMGVAAWICTVSNSTMVPIRFVSYALGLEEGAVRWDPETSTATVDAGHRIVQFQTGNSFYVVNGVPIRMVNAAGQPVEMQIRYERSFVPFRALGEAFNIPVSWDAERAVAIYNAPTHF